MEFFSKCKLNKMYVGYLATNEQSTILKKKN